jgi:hypothetical protein
MTSTTTARFGVVAIPANPSSNRFTGEEFDNAYPVTKTSTIWNANARMLNSPLYHPVRIRSADPFGAKIAANSAVSIVRTTAKIYGSGVIRSKRKRKNEVIFERSVRGTRISGAARRRVGVSALFRIQGLIHPILVSCPRNRRYFVAIKIGRRQGGPSRTDAKGSYLNRHLTDDQHHLALGASYLHNSIMRTTVMIEDDVYAIAKQIAEHSGRTLGEVISQLARKGLISEPSFDIKNGVPVFRIGDSAAKIPGSRAAEFLDEED